MEKLLKSAVANAIDRYEVDAKDLKIKSIVVNKGMALKRYKPAAFGRAHPYHKHSSHVEIVLVAKEGVKVAAKDKKIEPVETVDLTKTKDKKEEVKKTEKKADKVSSKEKANKKEADKPVLTSKDEKETKKPAKKSNTSK